MNLKINYNTISDIETEWQDKMLVVKMTAEKMTKFKLYVDRMLAEN